MRYPHNYLTMAEQLLKRFLAGPQLAGLVQTGTYHRVVPPTPRSPGVTRTQTVHVLMQRYDGRPIADVPWQSGDRKVGILHAELGELEIPVVQDIVRFDGHRYTVVQYWEDAPGLLWSLQVHAV